MGGADFDALGLPETSMTLSVSSEIASGVATVLALKAAHGGDGGSKDKQQRRHVVERRPAGFEGAHLAGQTLERLGFRGRARS